MISNNQIKHIRSLQQKKYRDLHHEFIAEGDKLVREILRSSLVVKELYHTSNWVSNIPDGKVRPTQVSAAAMSRMSALKTPSEVMVIVEKPSPQLEYSGLHKGFSIALDEIQDPGNLGTIIRIAHWFGIENIICSENTADAFAPKVVQASMGAIANVQVIYTNLVDALKNAQFEGIPIVGTCLEGSNLYTSEIPQNGILVMGNEGKGIDEDVRELLDLSVAIPSFAMTSVGSESLNVAVATGILCSELARRAGYSK